MEETEKTRRGKEVRESYVPPISSAGSHFLPLVLRTPTGREGGFLFTKVIESTHNYDHTCCSVYQCNAVQNFLDHWIFGVEGFVLAGRVYQKSDVRNWFRKKNYLHRYAL